jgi:hypothetical protein
MSTVARIGRISLLLCGLLALAGQPALAQTLPQTQPQMQTQSQTSLEPIPANWTPAQLTRSLSFDMASKHTGQRYRIMLGLPHQPAPPGGYPVLWALDGLASFPLMEFSRPRPPSPTENPQWRKKVGDEPPGLIVAVGYASGEPMDIDARALDYTPPGTGGNGDTYAGDTFSGRHGGAPAFLRFLTEELRPLLARHFEMDPRRHTLFGFSYGGLFTLYTLSTQPQHFQRYWAASPSLWFGEHRTLRMLPERLKTLQFAQPPVSVMITVGRDEQYPEHFASPEEKKKLETRTMVDNAASFARLLQESGKEGLQARYQALPAHDHLDMLLHGTRHVIDFAFAP